MMHAGHGVEEMREVRRAPFERRDRLGMRRRRMADGEEHAVAEVADQLLRVLQLGSQRDDPARVGRQRDQRRELVQVGRADGGAVLRARRADVDVGPLEVDAADLGAPCVEGGAAAALSSRQTCQDLDRGMEVGA